MSRQIWRQRDFVLFSHKYFLNVFFISQTFLIIVKYYHIFWSFLLEILHINNILNLNDSAKEIPKQSTEPELKINVIMS